MKWSPWPGGGTRSFHVKVSQLKLQGYNFEEKERVGVIEVKWKGSKPGGPGVLVPFYGRRSWRHPKTYTSHRFLSRQVIEWDDEFKNLCNFRLKQGGNFSPWNLTLTLLRVSLSFAEVRNSHDSAGLGQDLDESDKGKLIRRVSYFRSFRKSSNERKSRGDRVTSDWHESFLSDSEGSPGNGLISSDVNEELNAKGESGSFLSHETQFDSGEMSWFLRKRKWLKGRPPRRKVEAFVDNNLTDSVKESNRTAEYSSQSDHEHGNCTTSRWEEREVEIESRDGQAKLTTNVFFATFDQRSEKAAGESACTALVAVIAHWLHLHQHSMPTRSKFDSLITQGSSEWQKLCSNETYINLFSNRHFDLETVLEADLRPLDVSPEKSFIGFFSPEQFESLKGLMSCDDIWNEINKNTKSCEPRIYIVSWNDDFFVLKVEANAYHIIDSLGERLFEGCNQAYILKFDDSSIMHGKTEKADDSEERLEVICSGKECCRHFIKRFLAAIPLKELEEDERKSAVSILPLHRHLQIEFHYTSSSSSSSSSSTSSTSSTNSLFR